MKYILYFFFLLQIQFCYCQETSDSISTISEKEYFKSYWNNGTRMITQPVRWKTKDWAVFGGSIGITTGLALIDEDINKPFKRWNNSNTSFGKAGNFMGSAPVMVGGTILTLGVSYIIKNPKLKNFALDNLQAQIFTGASTFVTKKLFGRARPYTGRGAHYWEGPLKNDDVNSFFSGHSSLAFSTATMIFLHSRKKLWVGLLSYSVATGISLSRMQYQKHWASDVFMGAICGWAVSTFIYHQNEKRRSAIKHNNLL